MNNAPKRDDTIKQVAERFSSAWDKALNSPGCLPPRVDDFLMSGHDPTELRHELERIDRVYRRTHPTLHARANPPASNDTRGQASMDTAEFPAPGGLNGATTPPDNSELNATMGFEPPLKSSSPTVDGEQAQKETSPASSSDTVDLPGSEANLATEFNATVDFSGDPDNTRQTVDYQADPTDEHGTVELNKTGESKSTKKDELFFSWDPGANSEVEDVQREGPQVRGYEILDELGRGGMGVVYRARHRGLKREVALKMILAGGHASVEQLERFRAEAEAVAQLQHPNIVQIYDVGEQDGLPYFSLEFIDGGSLEDIADGKPLVPIHAAEMVEQLAQAMYFAHERGIVHRDLKPGNVLLSQDGIPKITDFGLVKRVEDDSGQTRTGTIMGTPSFMAPEQGRGQKDIGPPADIYALGAILYTLLTGRPPFLAATAMDTIMQLMNDEPVPPSKLQPKIPRDIETICLKCLHKEPERRYESAEALANDLARFCRGEPILARPVGNFERIWRWCRRNPWVAVPSAAAALLALAVTIGGPIATAIIYQQKEKAVEAQGLAEKNERIADRNAELADQQKEIAKEQRVLALETLNKVVTQVEEQLRDRSELNDLRQSVLSLALDGLDQVSRTDESADLADRSIGAAHQRMGDILTRAGKADEALGQYEKALVIFEKLLKEDKNNDLARWNSALTYDGIGDVKNKTLDDAQVVRNQFKYALYHREVLASRGPALHPKIQPFMIEAALVNSHGRLGNVSLQSFCDPGAAVENFEQAAKHAEALLASLPDHPVAKQSLSGAWYVLAQALYRMDRTDEADELVAKAMETRQSLLDDSPQSIKAQQDLAVTHWLRGDVLLRAGQNEQALAAYETAHALRLELFANDQENSEMQEDLAKSYYRLGTAYRSLAQRGCASSLCRMPVTKRDGAGGRSREQRQAAATGPRPGTMRPSQRSRPSHGHAALVTVPESGYLVSPRQQLLALRPRSAGRPYRDRCGRSSRRTGRELSEFCPGIAA